MCPGFSINPSPLALGAVKKLIPGLFRKCPPWLRGTLGGSFGVGYDPLSRRGAETEFFHSFPLPKGEGRLYLTFVLALLITLGLRPILASAQPARYAVIVSSVSGEEEFQEKFWNWSHQMYESLNEELKFPKETVFLLTADPVKESTIPTVKATKVELSKVFDRLASKTKPNDILFIFLIGHGNFDGSDYKFNLVGPDITGSELKAILDRFSNQQVVFVCATPCSGILIKTLSQKGRVIITATKNEFENNKTIFAQFFVEAFKNKAADLDKNAQVSLLEAYLYTAQKVDAWYKDQNLLATEHPLLEDNGDGIGTSLPSPANNEGLLASKISLGEPMEAIAKVREGAIAGPQLQALYSDKQKTEAAIQELRYKKASLSESEYNKNLEDLLVQLAQINQKIKNLEKK
jgi:hypothetical protein